MEDPDAEPDSLHEHPAFDDERRHDLPGPGGWPVIEEVVEYENTWFVGGYDLVEQPDGRRKRYYWAELASATVVVAVHEGSVLFVEQYRPTIRETQLELPAGMVHEGESYVEAAARELEEETGFRPGRTHHLQTVCCTTGLLRHRRGFVFADGLTQTGPDPGRNEFLTLRRVPVEEALPLARETPTNDATLEGLLLARQDGYLTGG